MRRNSGSRVASWRRPLGAAALCVSLIANTGAAAAGPPTLPPPREFNAPPPPEPNPTPTTEPRSDPAPAPTNPPPSTSPPASTNEPAPSSEEPVTSTPAPQPPPAAFNFGQPEVVDPPQPPASSLPPNNAAAPTGPASTRAPRMDQPSPVVLPELELPPKPDTKGTGVLATAGVLFVAAVGEYIAAHVLLRRRCVRPLTGLTLMSEETNAYVADCSITMMQAGALKLHGSINALAGIGVAAAGASIRARYDAHIDVFETGRHRSTQSLRIAGASMLGVGLFAWLSSAVGTWAGTIACTQVDCVERLRATQNALTLGSFALITGGTGLLTYGLLYERRHRENATTYRHIQQLQLLPTADRHGAGFSLVGRF